jgi:CRP-like cAMP-binding protein
MANVIDVLKDAELFRGLDADRLEKLSTLCRGARFPKDATIFEEGGEATDLYVLQSGLALLEMQLRPIPDRPVIPTPLETVVPGECFGWSALVEPFSYTLTARAYANCTTLAMASDMLGQAILDDPTLGRELMSALTRLLARRLVDTRLRLTSGLGMVMQTHETEGGS